MRCAVVVILACIAFAPAARAAGSVRGQVRVFSVSPDGKRLGEKADRSDAIVYVPDFEEKVPPGKPLEIRQVNKAFVPDLLVVPVGQKVSFVNADARLHNVFSRSRAADFDLGTYASGTKTWTFQEPGLVDVYCNIHESMAATLFVLPNRAYQKTGPDGRFQLEGIPPGQHTVFVWLRNGTVMKQTVVVQDGQVTALPDFELEQRPLVPHKDKAGHAYPEKPRKDYQD